MRRKQTTLIVTSIMVFLLLTMSQLPSIQSVQKRNVNQDGQNHEIASKIQAEQNRIKDRDCKEQSRSEQVRLKIDE